MAAPLTAAMLHCAPITWPYPGPEYQWAMTTARIGSMAPKVSPKPMKCAGMRQVPEPVITRTAAAAASVAAAYRAMPPNLSAR